MSTTGRMILIISVSVVVAATLLLIGSFIGATTRGSISGWMHTPPFAPFATMIDPGWMENERGMMGRSYRSLPEQVLTGQGEESIEIIDEQLADFLSGREDLEVGEIMIFDNHAYAQIVESDTGIGAMEVLVDATGIQITPEQGPNMMWNLKYGSMHGRGMMANRSEWTGGLEMPIDSEEAVQLAQRFLVRQEPRLTADEHAEVFYG